MVVFIITAAPDGHVADEHGVERGAGGVDEHGLERGAGGVGEHGVEHGACEGPHVVSPLYKIHMYMHKIDIPIREKRGRE